VKYFPAMFTFKTFPVRSHLRMVTVCSNVWRSGIDIWSALRWTLGNIFLSLYYCYDRKSRAACAQSFAPWQQATIEIMLAISLIIACSRYTYNGVILHAQISEPILNTDICRRGPLHVFCSTTGSTDKALCWRLYQNVKSPHRFCWAHHNHWPVSVALKTRATVANAKSVELQT